MSSLVLGDGSASKRHISPSGEKGLTHLAQVHVHSNVTTHSELDTQKRDNPVPPATLSEMSRDRPGT